MSNDIQILDGVEMPQHRGQMLVDGNRRTSILYSLEVGQCAVFPLSQYKRSQVHGKIANTKKFVPDRVFKCRTIVTPLPEAKPEDFPAMVVWRTQ